MLRFSHLLCMLRYCGRHFSTLLNMETTILAYNSLRKTVWSHCQMNGNPWSILNVVIHSLMGICSLVSNWNIASCIKAYKGVRHPTKCNTIINVKLFQTVHRRIYCRIVLTSSYQMSLYKIKCIRIFIIVSLKSKYS